ncbi:nicotinamide-nucleotide adenylyltransferase [Trifolium repens]|nr:nicotinamide-nucleotide adenylyltransferase [Trifolium repens]
MNPTSENRRLGCIIANQILQLDELFFFLELIVCIFWIPEQVKSICRDYGVVCICREGQDVENTISDDNILNENQWNPFDPVEYLKLWLHKKISANIAASIAAKTCELGLASHLPRPKDLVKYAESCILMVWSW